MNIMSPNKTGIFIASKRKECNMTQKDLAKKLSVLDKTISRWETGKGYPDIEILPKLSEALNVSVSEILSGENGINLKEDELEKNLLKLCEETNKKTYLKMLNYIFFIICIGISMFIKYAYEMPSVSRIFYFVLTVICCILLIYSYKKYKLKILSNQILLFVEIISTVSVFLLYSFGYEKFTPPDTINFVFILFSLIFFLPIVIDRALNEINMHN